MFLYIDFLMPETSLEINFYAKMSTSKIVTIWRVKVDLNWACGHNLSMEKFELEKRPNGIPDQKSSFY